MARLLPGTAAAATTLLKLLIDPATPASVKVRATGVDIFNHAAKATDIDARVAALEAAADSQQRGY